MNDTNGDRRNNTHTPGSSQDGSVRTGGPARRSGRGGTPKRRRLTLVAMAGLTAAFVVVLLVVLVGQSGRHDAVLMEYAASRTLTEVSDATVISGTIPEELPSGVIAFGIYNVSGERLMGTETAPGTLEIDRLTAAPGPDAKAPSVFGRYRGGTEDVIPEWTGVPSAGPNGSALPTFVARRDGRSLLVVRAAGGAGYAGRGPGSRGAGRGGGNADRSGMAGEPAATTLAPAATTLAPAATTSAPAGRVLLYLNYDVTPFLRERNIRYAALAALAVTVTGLALGMLRLTRAARAAEEWGRKQDQLAQLGSAARTITHEIKNPLASIRLQTALLKKIAPDAAGKPVAAIESDVARLTDLVDRVRNFLKDPRGNPEVIDIQNELPALVDRLAYPTEVVFSGAQSSATNGGTTGALGTAGALGTVGPTAGPTGGRGTAAAPGATSGPITICMDRVRFESVIGNLVANAAESMGGESGWSAPGVTGTGNPEPAPRDTAPVGRTAPEPVRVEITTGRDSIYVRIGDRGPGIRAEHKERIFDPFFTTKETGSGVGLSAVRQFVEAAGGTVHAEDREGGGTWMRVELPRRRSCAGADS